MSKKKAEKFLERLQKEFEKDLIGKQLEIESKYGFKNQFLEAYQLDFHKLNNPLKYLSGRSFKISLNDEFLNLINSIKGE